MQRSIWMEPFPFYTLCMVITYATHIYDIEDGKKLFAVSYALCFVRYYWVDNIMS